MASYPSESKRSLPWAIVSVLAILMVIFIGSAVAVRQVYLGNLKPVNASQRTSTVTVESGSSVHDITVLLKDNDLIRSVWAFEWYVRSKEVRDALQAGTYEIRPSQSVPEIVDVLTGGKIARDLVTILPAQRLAQIRERLISSGFDKKEVDTSLDPSLYKGHPALVDKPDGASLEGYLYPDSFEKTATTKPETIIRASLDEMAKRLTADMRAGIVKQGLNIHQGVILASIVEKEVSKPADRNVVAQVFLTRLKMGMVLGSDVTAIYGSITATGTSSIKYDTAYNTHLHGGLPPGPISNVSAVSLGAVANPASTDFIYFVSGDDGATYFSKTLDEHNNLVNLHCKKLCSE